jgi:hypothetical protein
MSREMKGVSVLVCAILNNLVIPAAGSYTDSVGRTAGHTPQYSGEIHDPPGGTMDGRSFRLFTLSTVIGMLFVLALALAGRSPAAMAQPAAEGGPMEVVAGGLDNPRHMTFGPDGALYVAEAGSGGAGPCAPGPEGGDICIGESGAVTRIKDGMQERVVDDLVSLAGEAAADSATGPHDVAFTGEGDLRVIIGLGADPNSRGDSGPFGALSDNLGQLVAVDANGDWMNEVDVSAHEATDNPDGGALDSICSN